MISAIDNNKNQYYERIQAVRLFEEPPAERKFGALLTYGREHKVQQGEFNLLHPDIQDGRKAQAFDFVA